MKLFVNTFFSKNYRTKKFIVAGICAFAISSLTASSLSAEVFSMRRTSTRTEYPCPFTRGGCSESELEDLVLDKCYDAGYDTCVTIEKKTTSRRRGMGLCGYQSKWTCIVRVKGY